jgi:hypothetical protein
VPAKISKPKTKKMKKFRLKWQLLAAAIVISGATFLQSCSEDDDSNPSAPPSVTLEAPSFLGIVGSDASVDVTIEADGGLETLTVLKNGAAFDTETYSGEKEATYTLAHTVEGALGSVTNFSFQVTDEDGKSSNLATYTVTVSAKNVVTKSGVISASETWTSDNIYQLSGYVRVGDDDYRDGVGGTIVNIRNVTLTIEPGTVIMGLPKTETTPPGTLIIHRGNKIIALGTAEEPIVFTSSKPAGQRAATDWAGLVIVGRDVNNQGANVQLEGGYGAYHGIGDDPLTTPGNDDSGDLAYVRVEFAGNPIQPNQEVNSFTFGSVGSGTSIDYLQASYGGDDAFEWFGGTVNAKHLIAYRGLDDDFDVDFGFSGKVQYAIAIRDNTLADQSGSNGFEVDNDGSGTGATPFTSGTFANITIIGPKKTQDMNIQDNFQNGMHLRRNNKLKIYNAVVTGYPNGIFIDGSTTIANAAAGDLQLRNVYLAGVNNWGGNGYGSVATAGEIAGVTGLPFGTNTQNPQLPRGFVFATTADINAAPAMDWFKTGSFANVIEDKWTDLGISSTLFDLGTPTFLPTAGSVLLNKANLWANTTADATFFSTATVNYVGAFGATDWTTGWANFDPKNTVY